MARYGANEYQASQAPYCSVVDRDHHRPICRSQLDLHIMAAFYFACLFAWFFLPPYSGHGSLGILAKKVRPSRW